MSPSPKPPLRARLHRYKLTSDELVLLQAMVEHCSDGSTIWASIPRLSAYSKLSERKVQRLIHGEDRGGRHIAGLRERGILSELSSGNGAKRRPATYRLNEAALEEDPRMAPYRKRQQQLPGIHLAPAPGEAIPDRSEAPDEEISTVSTTCADDGVAPVSAGHPSGVRCVRYPVSAGHPSGVRRTPDSKAFDPKAINPKSLTQHADGVMTIPAWIAIKEQLRSELSSEEWDLWVRPARLFRMMDAKTMLIAVPHGGAIMAAATARKGLLNEVAARGGLRAVLTRYPDEWEREQLKERFGSLA